MSRGFSLLCAETSIKRVGMPLSQITTDVLCPSVVFLRNKKPCRRIPSARIWFDRIYAVGANGIKIPPAPAASLPLFL